MILMEVLAKIILWQMKICIRTERVEKRSIILNLYEKTSIIKFI